VHPHAGRGDEALAGRAPRLQHPHLGRDPDDRVRGRGRHRRHLRVRPGDPLGAREDRGRAAAGRLMLIPLKYNVRNLVVRKVSALMTVLGIALVVTVFLLVMSLAEGVRKTLSTTVSAKNVIILRVGAQSDVQSYVS